MGALMTLVTPAALAHRPPAHALHVCLVEAHYRPETKLLEITTKVFTDDLELALGQRTRQSLRLTTPQDLETYAGLISRWLKDHLQWRTDSLPTPLAVDYLGAEMNQEAVFIYSQVPVPSGFTSLNVSCTVLLEQYDDQVNIISVHHPRALRAGRTYGTRPELTLSWGP